MTSRKVMRGAELRRIGNDLVLIDRYPDGTKQTLARPIEELSEDHEAAVAPDPHPSPEERAETSEVGGCTRTASIHERVAAELRKLEGRDVSIRTVGRRGPTIVVRDVDSARRAFDCPVIAIADGEVLRA